MALQKLVPAPGLWRDRARQHLHAETPGGTGGSTYALRWLSVVNDETRDHLLAVDDGVKVPGLYGDFPGFTETHGLPPHDSAVIKDHLRRNFWEAVRGDSGTVPATAE